MNFQQKTTFLSSARTEFLFKHFWPKLDFPSSFPVPSVHLHLAASLNPG